jgi:hypothetical protein
MAAWFASFFFYFPVIQKNDEEREIRRIVLRSSYNFLGHNSLSTQFAVASPYRCHWQTSLCCVDCKGIAIASLFHRLHKTMAETCITSDEVLSTDVICKRGSGGNSHPGNQEFRKVISTNKHQYDNLPSRDREDFSREIWNEMSREGTRFVREASPGFFVVLDDEKCARKIWSALRDYRGGGGGSLQPLPRPQKPQQASTKPKPDKAQQPKAKKQKLNWMTVAAAASPVQTKNFDESAQAAIKSVLENEALDAALRKNWGTNYEKKRECFEEQVLTRYRAAARQKGMSAEDFSKQLLPVLIREAGGVNCVITESSSMRTLL